MRDFDFEGNVLIIFNKLLTVHDILRNKIAFCKMSNYIVRQKV